MDSGSVIFGQAFDAGVNFRKSCGALTLCEEDSAILCSSAKKLIDITGRRVTVVERGPVSVEANRYFARGRSRRARAPQ